MTVARPRAEGVATAVVDDRNGDSRCSGTDPIGQFGSFGEVMNALGVRWEAAAGPYDATRIGNPGTGTNRPTAREAACPWGSPASPSSGGEKRRVLWGRG